MEAPQDGQNLVPDGALAPQAGHVMPEGPGTADGDGAAVTG
jgi:hypothetical protein